MNFVPKVGEEFMVRSWEDLRQEYGSGNPKRVSMEGSNCFLSEARNICGIPFVCEEIVEDRGYRDKNGQKIYRVRNREMRKALYSGQVEITTMMIEPVAKTNANVTVDFLM